MYDEAFWPHWWSVVRHKCQTSSGPPAPASSQGVTHILSLNLHLLQVLVGWVLITMVLHLVQVTLFWGEHRVNLLEQRLQVTVAYWRALQSLRTSGYLLCSPVGLKAAQRPFLLDKANKGWYQGHREGEKGRGER